MEDVGRRRDDGAYPAAEGRRPVSADGYGLARWLGRGTVAPRRLDSGLRRNDGYRGGLPGIKGAGWRRYAKPLNLETLSCGGWQGFFLGVLAGVDLRYAQDGFRLAPE